MRPGYCGGIAMVLQQENKFYLDITVNERSAWFEKGEFGDITFLKEAIFYAEALNVLSGVKFFISSFDEFEKVGVKKIGNETTFYFDKPKGIENLTFIVKAETDENGISWWVKVVNDSARYSVLSVSYPTPTATGKKYNLFLPYTCGKLVPDAGKKKIRDVYVYPGLRVTMGYFAVYGENGGVYLGFEDERAAAKEFRIDSKDDTTHVRGTFFAVNAGKIANSFEAYGKIRWQYFRGDWYDASLIYADFVYNKAAWLPKIDENGRMDTPERFKEAGYWVCDYIPNNERQGDNRPMHISAGSDIYEPDYWYKAVIELQKELNVPVAYHVYNWHTNPFNIEYPHYLPAKDGFKEGVELLQKNGVMVCPYINAVNWEMNDYEGGYETTFENTGRHGAVLDLNGTIDVSYYPQKTKSGVISHLASICPGYYEWHNIIDRVVRGLETQYGVDGVYYDVIAAHSPKPCYNAGHSHLPGGGSYWVEGYNLMMEKINRDKPKDSFYFTEGNGEAYAKSFDGFLTWVWVHNGEVPAFPLIYAGYIEMVGRCLIGKKKEDDDFFKYSLVKMFLYGQQLGWGKADVVYNKTRMEFLKKIVSLRYSYNKFFHRAKMLRPPVAVSNKPPVVTSPALWYDEDITMDQVLCGAWKERDESKIVVFVFNTANEKSKFTITFNAEEYGLNKYEYPPDFKREGNDCKVCGTLEANGYMVYELKRR